MIIRVSGQKDMQMFCIGEILGHIEDIWVQVWENPYGSSKFVQKCEVVLFWSLTYKIEIFIAKL